MSAVVTRAALLTLLLLNLPVSLAFAQDVSGRASVIDGDTIEIGGKRIRLFGIDAPEGVQTCKDEKGADWRCGQRAAKALSIRIGRNPVSCKEVDRDRYDRIVATCRAGGQEINAWLVENGWARAYASISRLYLPKEMMAKQARRNIWSGEALAPWDFREQQRSKNVVLTPPVAQKTPSLGVCPIKGNINTKGICIYHLPGMRDYDAVRISPEKGEKFFCNETQARAAGCRKAQR